jgi:5-hydroxyisourate hydrolase
MACPWQQRRTETHRALTLGLLCFFRNLLFPSFARFRRHAPTRNKSDRHKLKMNANTRAARIAQHLEHSMLIANPASGKDPNVSTISSHALDQTLGRPAQNLRLHLRKVEGATRQELGTYSTNSDGRVPGTSFPPLREAGVYEVQFETEEYFKATGVREYFYPTATIQVNSSFRLVLAECRFVRADYRSSW